MWSRPVELGAGLTRSASAFTGAVKQVVFDLKPAVHNDEHALHEHASLNAVAAGVAA